VGSFRLGAVPASAGARLALCLAISGFAARAFAADATPFYATTFSRTPSAAELTALGRTLFFARELSHTQKLACSDCHDPHAAFGPANARAVQLAGADGKTADLRAAPSLRYLQGVPRFTEHYEEPDGDGSDQGPTGGFGWDGRAQSAHEQALLPLMSPLEMANRDGDSLVARVRRSRLAPLMREAFGDDALSTTDRGLRALTLALEVFQQSPPDFAPYSSKYDEYLRRRAPLTPREARGLALFEDPQKGNCARCHPSRIKEGAFPAFTDYGFIALGVPRNRELPANRDARFFDLGLCGPLRTDLSTRGEYCGRFRTPSLRNVAVKRRWFHNGYARTLAEAVRFYVERDVRPARWYPRNAQGGVSKLDDLPARYHGNVDDDPPFGARAQPRLDDDEIDAVVAFLRTLTDRDLAR
jgi:cytochrome c peroxidase